MEISASSGGYARLSLTIDVVRYRGSLELLDRRGFATPDVRQRWAFFLISSWGWGSSTILDLPMRNKSIKHLTRAQKRKLYAPYWAAIGELATTWNQLHDKLSDLFWTVLGSPIGAVPLAVWHSTPSDFAQRKMLRAATEARFNKASKERVELIWLLDVIDKSLTLKRNDALHAPLYIVTRPHGTNIEPGYPEFHPRSKSLSGKDVLDEYAWYIDYCTTLVKYSSQLSAAMNYPQQFAWPDRPSLPTLVHTTTAKETPRASRPKEPARRQES